VVVKVLPKIPRKTGSGAAAVATAVVEPQAQERSVEHVREMYLAARMSAFISDKRT